VQVKTGHNLKNEIFVPLWQHCPVTAHVWRLTCEGHIPRNRRCRAVAGCLDVAWLGDDTSAVTNELREQAQACALLD
jgi:hypothetical protein